MSSIYKKPASMSNWFSSLRRPQKSKKHHQQQQYQQSSSIDNIINDNNNDDDDFINNKNKLQKSCIDLTSNSIFYTDFPKTYIINDNNDDIKLNNNISDHHNSTTISCNSNSSDNIIIINNNNNNLQQLCSKCCYQINSKSSSTINTPTSITPLLDHRKHTLISNLNNNKIPILVKSFSYDEPIIIKNQLDNTEFKIETDKTTDIQITKLPSKLNNKNGGGKLLYNKRSEFKRTTTTMITRTMVLQNNNNNIINNRDGIIFNDNDGDIISKQFQKYRANSLGSILDSCDNNNKNCWPKLSQQEEQNNQHHPNSPFLGDNNDFLFIDENCNSNNNSGNDSNNNNNNSQELNQINNVNNNCDSKKNSLNNDNYEQNFCIACKCPLIQQKVNDVIDDENHIILSQQLPLPPHTIEKFAENFKSNFDNMIKTNTKKQIKDELCEVVSEMETLDSQEDSKHSNKDKQMSIGRKKFNMDPKKGIEYLVDNRLLQTEPQDIANFLYKGEGLNKTAIGDYLGEKNDFNEKVLKAFVELHDFTNLILVQALRQFLWSFRLPGEAQKIDRMMECFAQRYCQLNPDIFTNTDTCYVLSFAIIMLNTSLHNPSVKDKPSVEQFITMNRGINNGGDLPRGLLESLYESIRTEPFKIPQDDGNDLMHTFFNPDKEGWLWKQGGRYKSWKRRWFILNDNCLYYFEYTTDKEPRGIIPLENISVREIQDRNKPHCFELYACGGADIIKACKTDSEGKVVEGKHTVYRMSAATEEDKLEWIKRLTQSISHNPFYDILVQRKKKALAKS